MNDMKLYLEVLLKGQSQFVSSLHDMGNKTNSTTRRMVNSWGVVDKRMSNVYSSMTKIAALLGGGALLRQAVLEVTNFERSLTEMRLTGELTAKEMENIRKEIVDLSAQTLQLPEDQLETFKDMVAAGIDPRQVVSGLKEINRTATATFSDVRDIGKTAVDLFQKMEIKPEKLDRAFNIMHKAGKAGRFEIKDMAQYFPEVLAATSRYGITGERGTAQVAAMLQIARRNRGNPGEAATDMKAFFSHMVSYQKQFQKVGFNVFDYIDTKSGKFKKGKDIDAFFEDLRKKTHGGSDASLKMMGIRDYESSNFMAGLMKDWTDYKMIRDDALGAADQDVVGTDFDKVKETKWAKLRKLEIERSKAMKSTGSSWFAEKTLSLGNWAIEHPLGTGSLGLGGYAAYKWLKTYLGDFSFKGGGAAGPGTGNAPGPGNSRIVGPRTSSWYKPTVGAATGGGLIAELGMASISLIPAIVTGVIGYLSMKTGSSLAEQEARYTSTEDLMALRSRQMVMGGGPKSFQVKTIDAELNKRFAESIKNDIKIDVNIEGPHRIFSRSDNMNTTTTINLKRGNFFDSSVMGTGNQY